MFNNLLNLWILSRVVLALLVAVLSVAGLAVGLSIVRSWQASASSEHQLVVERRAEFVATILQVAAIVAVVGLLFTVLVAERSVGSIRGAMCAYGVLGSTESGFQSLLYSYLTANAFALWLILHRFDMRLRTLDLTPWKLLNLVMIAPLACVDLYFVISFVTELDLSVIASCCSVTLDSTGGVAQVGVDSDPVQVGLLGTGAVVAAIGTSLAVRIAPGRITALLATACAVLAPALLLPAVAAVVAPHALETPTHACPFCLLRSQGGYVGWPIYAAAFAGSVMGMGIGVVEICRGQIRAARAVRAMQRSLAAGSACAWAMALFFAAYPVLRYLIMSGGVPVFGEIP